MIGENVLKFRGSPLRMEALVPFSGEPATTPISIDLESESLGAPGFYAARVADGYVRLKLRLSRSAPPGSYKGTIHLGSQDVPFVAEIDPAVHLTVSPRSVKCEAPANSTVNATLTLINSGNAPCTIRSAYGLGLFRTRGMEDALSAAYRAPRTDNCSWVDRLGEELKKAHSGLIRVGVTQGSGILQPGEMKTVELAFRLPKKLEAGQTYSGTLPIQNLAYYIEVCVAPKNGVSAPDTDEELKTSSEEDTAS